MRGGYFPRWTEREHQYLIQHWGKKPAARVAGNLRRSVAACYTRASVLGLKSERCARVLRGDNGFLGTEFYLGILEEFADYTAGQIAIRRKVPLNRARTWIQRAKKYRDMGKLG